MNALQRFELFTLNDGEKAIEVVEDTKIPNAATIVVAKQDHTLANMIRGYLLKNPKVLFAGYKAPHPLDPHFILKIQTDGTSTPLEVLQETCNALIALVGKIDAKFREQFQQKELEIGLEEPFGAPGAGRLPRGEYAEPRRANAMDYLDF
ncbi:RBP11-like subunit of RNA polymerase [Dacryopinax primogenitus]|uniref:RBP11-like subunit of RNA polymerase n=1 Tax=Dacryopinax primogenitus (strain DJM 731) TaxID=1858805 RepID=M5G100_DACPD|nr:RBP11-like subunit of RNA polymerase [Dacryopinax primogenitus]EJU02419.1 RBP11-like subunit of RNA polymerase [Dacryopinax primogenitus]